MKFEITYEVTDVSGKPSVKTETISMERRPKNMWEFLVDFWNVELDGRIRFSSTVGFKLLKVVSLSKGETFYGANLHP